MAPNPFDAAVDDALAKPQVQDRWGRSPGDPEYGKDPEASGAPKAEAGTAPLTGSFGSATPEQIAAAPQQTQVAKGIGGTADVLGGGWDQFTTDPNSFQAGLKTALSRGLSGDQAIDWMDANGWKGAKNPAGGGIQYYPESGMFGLPGGYKVTPGAGGKLDMYRVDESGGRRRPLMSPMALPGMTPSGMPLMQGTMGALQPSAVNDAQMAGDSTTTDQGGSNASATTVTPGGDRDPFAASGGGIRLPNGTWIPKQQSRVNPAASRAALMNLLQK